MLTAENFQHEFFKNIQQEKHVSNRSDYQYLLAYSGGCDSHVLLHLLSDLKRLDFIKNLTAIYIDHQLQDDSTLWAEHCLQQCELLQISCDVIKVKVDTQSNFGLEAAARTARYKAIAERVTDKTIVLTAQHADDQVETFLLQSLRGSGVKGLSAMPVTKDFSNGLLYRPLLGNTRLDILDYANEHKLNWVEDVSNENTHFDRNYLRHEVIPILKNRWPTCHKTLGRVTQHQSEAALLIDELAQIDLQTLQPEKNTLAIDKLKLLSFERKKNVLRYWLNQTLKLTMPDNIHLMRIINEIVTAEEDTQPQVNWGEVIVRRFNGMLYADNFIPDEMEQNKKTFKWSPDKNYSIRVAVNGCEATSKLSTQLTVGQGLSKKKLNNKTVSIRFRQGGEVCSPQGRGNHRHKLKKLFQEWKVPPWQRNNIPLVYADNELAQVVGYCLCTPFVADELEEGYVISCCV